MVSRVEFGLELDNVDGEGKAVERGWRCKRTACWFELSEGWLAAVRSLQAHCA